MIPLGPDLGYDRHPPFLLNKKHTSATALINRLLTPMGTSIALDATAQKKKKTSSTKKQRKTPPDAVASSKCLEETL